MYKVFVNDRPIILTSDSVMDTNGKFIPLNKMNLDITVLKVANREWENVCLFHPNKEGLLHNFKKMIPVVVAAGGLVKNAENQILFIKRNGKWDLPKGRVEKDESIEEAALRETAEETGVKGLKIIKPLGVTYHIFNRNNKIKLKETYWYEMYTDYTGDLKPEKSEGIKKVKWKNEQKTKKALKNSYANILELFE